VRNLVRFRAVMVFLVSILPVASCSLFERAPDVTIVRPHPGDTVAVPVVVEVTAHGHGPMTVNLNLDGWKLAAYTSGDVKDSFLISPGGHALEAVVVDENQRAATATIIFMAR
jgi:hypothetical protein